MEKIGKTNEEAKFATIYRRLARGFCLLAGVACLSTTAHAQTSIVVGPSGDTISGTLTNYLITFAPDSTSAEYLYITGSATLNGGGELKLVDGNSIISGYYASGPLNNVDNLIHGQGTISIGITNTGTIEADNGTLSLGSAVTNTGGLVEIKSGDTLGGSAVITGGSVTVETGATIGAVTINQGTISGGTATLNGATLEDATNLATLEVGTAYLTGTITNSGLISFASGATSAEYLYITGSTTLTGGGELKLVDGNSIISGYYASAPLTNVDNLIHGQGTISISTTNEGTIAADNGTLSVSNLTNQGGDVEVCAGDTLAVSGPFLQTSGSTKVDGTFSGGADIEGGTLSGVGVITGGVINSGTVAPGGSPGTLTMDTTYTQNSGGVLAIELAGTDANEYDHLDVTGSVTLMTGAKLELDFINGFAPQTGDVFDFLQFGSLTGDFDSSDVSIDGLEPGFEFHLGQDGPDNYALFADNDGISIVPEPNNFIPWGIASFAIFFCLLRRRFQRR